MSFIRDACNSQILGLNGPPNKESDLESTYVLDSGVFHGLVLHHCTLSTVAVRSIFAGV